MIKMFNLFRNFSNGANYARDLFITNCDCSSEINDLNFELGCLEHFDLICESHIG